MRIIIAPEREKLEDASTEARMISGFPTRIHHTILTLLTMGSL